MLLRLKFRFAAPGTCLADLSTARWRDLWARRRKLAHIARHPGYVYGYTLIMDPRNFAGTHPEVRHDRFIGWHPELAGWL